jgi:hypothetical protein
VPDSIIDTGDFAGPWMSITVHLSCFSSVRFHF